MLFLTLPVALSVLGFIYKSPVFLGNIETNTKYVIAWKASLDVVAAMAKDDKMAETLKTADCEKLQDITSYLDRNESPLVLLSVLEEAVRAPEVESIVKLYPEYELAMSSTKDLLITITENFQLPEMTQKNWKGLLLKTKMEATSKNLNYRSMADCTAICEKQIKDDENYLELMTTDNGLRNMLSEWIPSTTEDAIRFLQMGILLKLPTLADRSAKFLQNVLSMNNVVQIFQVSFKTEMIELKRKAEEYFFWEFEDIVKTDTKFLSLKVDEIFHLLMSREVNVPNEYSIFEAIERWVTFGLATRKEHMATLMTTVRFYLCPIILLNRMLDHNLLAGLDSVQQSIRATIFMKQINSPKLPDLIKKQQRHLHETLFVFGGEGPKQSNLKVETFSTSKKQWINHENLINDNLGRTKVVAVGQTVIVFEHRWHNVSSLDPIKKEWKFLSKVPNESRNFAVAELNGQVYVLGGLVNGKETSICHVFNPKTRVWTRIASLNMGLVQAGATSYKGQIYLVGGDGNSHQWNTVQAFDPKSNKWTVTTSPLNHARREFALVSDGDNLWAFGGYGYGYLNSVEKLDPETATWEVMPAMPFSRGALDVVYFSGSFFVIGGFWPSGVSSKVAVYNPRRKTWTELSDLNFARYFLGACVVQDLPNANDYI